MTAPGGLAEQAHRYALDVARLLTAVLPGAPTDVVAEVSGDRVVLRPSGPVLLRVAGEPLAELNITVRCRLDSRGRWLAVDASRYELKALLDRTPVLRWDYVRDAHTVPAAHINVHAHRGALSHLLSQSGHPSAHDMAKLHVPLGGARFRPCLEDVLQFLISECRFDSIDGWRTAVEAGRADWRRTQTKAVARDLPQVAAETLEDLGYQVTLPQTPLTHSQRALTRW